ncbi:hypothetical protein BIFGAL_03701 [Bifidobacterium gallicum DSM 20093 = LMG 11596]|uniref:Uncharacterized protein n=1 Tax=Bifidobacterium gallicum DSM 20093 = LMG 11596 TaxID=561180 RepID=D1NV23_9BIFI|nr:hypothetical protein BIFGAL_03701 [Bifidobacterium gallicum DSM 20093 = LMG 11596]KFI59635.1 hypothetical protein BGLCM_0303 [Bifidobacterium gallicum DSM 20093 = LMG 11596]
MRILFSVQRTTKDAKSGGLHNMSSHPQPGPDFSSISAALRIPNHLLIAILAPSRT